MKQYGITTYATEDRPQMTCYYQYYQWKEMIADLKENGVKFNAFVTNEDLK